VKEGPGALLAKKEEDKRQKYETSAKEHHATFRGLGICDTGRLGKNVYALYNELFKNCRTKKNAGDDDDEDDSQFNPKLWTIRSPKQLWLTRLRVKMLNLKEQRIDKYVVGLNRQRNSDLPHACV
jgi:hypothetical protein